MWASRSKPKKALDLNPTAGILLQSLVFFPQRCRNRLLQPSASSGVVLCSSAKRYPTDGHAIPPLRTSCYSLPSVGPPRTRTSQVSHSSPSATPLSCLPHLQVIPVWGLAVVHRLGALGAAWSTYESHRKRTVRGEPDGWDPRGPWWQARKVPPYYALYVDPADRSDPPAISSHARKCLLITHKKMNTPPASWDHHGGRLTCGPTKLTGTGAFVNFSQYERF